MESFHLVLFGSSLSTKDIETWLATALWRNLRELFLINEYSNEKPNILPSRLYTCKSLVILKLRGEIRLDVPRLSCLPSLKTFELILDKYFQGGPLRRLLSICPVLENLLVNCGWDDYDKGLITVTVPSLQRLTLYLHSETEGMLPRGLVIDSPSLKYLKLRDRHQWSRPGFSIETMPDLEEAYVNVQYCKTSLSLGLMAPTTSIERLIRSITSVKRLTICSEVSFFFLFLVWLNQVLIGRWIVSKKKFIRPCPGVYMEKILCPPFLINCKFSVSFIESCVYTYSSLQMRYSGGFVFNQLEHLKLCVCGGDSSNLLARLLEDSPNLRVLDIFEIVPSFFH